jgi:hypothetical protein
MLKTGLNGPYRLTFEGIESAVRQRSAGAYALGRITPSGSFSVNHVGRSDTDIAARLRDFIGSDSFFKFGYYPSSREAFEKECELFHDFRPPGTRVHPGRPVGSRWTCPRCGTFGRED